MPFSSNHGKAWTKDTLITLHKEHNFKRVLDIGAGSGTYSELLRDHIKAHWTAVEIWKPYIAEYKLADKYDEVWNRDARSLNLYPKVFGLILMGDVVEHMTKEEAVLLIDHMLEAGQFILISIPIEEYKQDAMFGNPYEAHIKDDWSIEECLETFPNIITYYVEDQIGCFLLGTI